jgi:hypothetical protein
VVATNSSFFVCCRAIRLPGNARDSLLLTFLDAKMSVIDFDPAKNEIVTTSIHGFDERRWTVRSFVN